MESPLSRRKFDHRRVGVYKEYPPLFLSSLGQAPPEEPPPEEPPPEEPPLERDFTLLPLFLTTKAPPDSCFDILSILLLLR